VVDTLTESFCERCGTRYSFDPPKPRSGTLSNVKVLGRGIRRLALTRVASLDEALASARADEDRAEADRLQEAFHGTFHLCLSCRQYTCSNCWNDGSGTCLTCNPTPESLAAEAAAAEAATRAEEERRQAAAQAEAEARAEADSDSRSSVSDLAESSEQDPIPGSSSITISPAPVHAPAGVPAQQLDGLTPGTSLDDFIAAYEAAADQTRSGSTETDPGDSSNDTGGVDDGAVRTNDERLAQVVVDHLTLTVEDGAAEPSPTPSIPDRPNWLLGRARPLEANEDEAQPSLADLSALFRERPAQEPDQMSPTTDPRESAEVAASDRSAAADAAGQELPGESERAAATRRESWRTPEAMGEVAASPDVAQPDSTDDRVAGPQPWPAASERRIAEEPNAETPAWLQDAARTRNPEEPVERTADLPTRQPWAAMPGATAPDLSPAAPWHMTARVDPGPDRVGEDPRIAAWQAVAPEAGGGPPAAPPNPPAIPPSFAARLSSTGRPAWEPVSAPAPIPSGARACGGCGLSLSANARFCRRCGTRQA
jgi:hypothetical protein